MPYLLSHLSLSPSVRRFSRRAPLLLSAAGTLLVLAGPAHAASEGVPAEGGAGALVLSLVFLLTLAMVWSASMTRAARRQAAACRSLREEAAQNVHANDERAAQRQEMEEGVQSLSRTNALLTEASDRFQELFQGLPVACVCCDREGRVMEWNRAWTRLHGLENPLGRSAVEALGGPAGVPELTEAMEAARDGEAREGVEWTYRRAGGQIVHVHSSLFPLRGPDGAVTGVLSADVDLSAQKEAEEALRESEERMHALYNTTSQQSLSFEEKTETLLEMGCAQFGLGIGILARAHGGEYRVAQARSPGDSVARGVTFDSCEAYCTEVIERAGGPRLTAYLSTPIRVDGEIWGTLCFACGQPRAGMFTSGDRELVRLMAQWIGSEIARKQAEEAVQASEARFRTAIGSMSEGLLLMDADGVVRVCNESAERILGVTQDQLETWRPLNPEYVAHREDGTPFPQGSYPLVVSLRQGQPQRNIIAGLPRLGGGLLWVSINSTPLFRPGEDTPHGAVATFADITERRRQEDLIAEQMIQIREHAAILEAQKRELVAVNAELETLALRDGLTGLSNRRAFGQRLALEMNRAMRYGTPLSLLLLDVDHFKEYNDAFGHVAGDEVLRALSRLLNVQGRETDFFARYGGEEFVAVLPHTDCDGARTMAERLRGAIADAPWTARAITASIGAATLLPGMNTEDDLVSAADRALYAAKTAGRNRVAHALSLTEPTPVCSSRTGF